MDLNVTSGQDTNFGDVLEQGNKVTVQNSTLSLDLFSLLDFLEGENIKENEIKPDIEQAMLAQNREDKEGFTKYLLSIAEKLGTALFVKFITSQVLSS